MRMSTPDAVVLGGGIIGLACARQLALDGLAVMLVEAQRGPAVEGSRSASWAAAGMLAPLVEAAGSPPLFAAARAARDLWPAFAEEIAGESGWEVEHDAAGCLAVALDAAGEARLERLAGTARELGESVLEVASADLARRVPDLARVRRALLLAGEHRVDNRRACWALQRSAAALGVDLELGRTVLEIEAEEREVRVTCDGLSVVAPWLVVAGGAWSGELPGLPPQPVRPLKGEMLRFDGVSWPWSGTLRAGTVYAVRRGRDQLLVGATEEDAGFDLAASAEARQVLLAATHRLLPGLAGRAPAEQWAGLRPSTPDRLPLLGPLSPPYQRVLVATGHHRHGILLAPWTARAVSRLVARRDADPAFAPQRFARLSTLGASV